MAKPTKKHLFIIRVGMDKACSRATAFRQVREELKGMDFYTTNLTSDPEQFWIRAVRSAPRKAVRQ